MRSRLTWLLIGVALLSPSLALGQMTAGTVNAKQSGTWNITNISGTVSLPTGAATEASLAKLTLTQGSTTSGQSGPLIQGAVTTSAPSYTTAQTSPLSLTTGGALRVDASAATVTISGTVTANQGTNNATPWNENVAQINGVAPLMGAGNTGTGSLRVTIATDQAAVATSATALTSIVTGQQAVTATAAVLPTNTAKQVCIKVLAAGTQDVFFGPSGVTTSNGNQLSPGDAVCLGISNSNLVYVIAAGTGSTVGFHVIN